MLRSKRWLNPTFHLLLSLVAVAILVWHDMYVGGDGWIALNMFFVYCIALLLGIVALFKLRRNARFAFGLAVILLFAVYRSRLPEGRAVLSVYDCDFSVCTSYRFGENGIWRYSSYTESNSDAGAGTYEFKDDTIYVYQNWKHFSSAAPGKLRQQMQKGFVIVVHDDINWSIVRLEYIEGKWVYGFSPRNDGMKLNLAPLNNTQ